MRGAAALDCAYVCSLDLYLRKAALSVHASVPSFLSFPRREAGVQAVPMLGLPLQAWGPQALEPRQVVLQAVGAGPQGTPQLR